MPLAPGLVQQALHVAVGKFEDLHIAGACGKAISVGEEAPLGRLPALTQRDHDFRIAFAAQARKHRRMALERAAQVSESGALHYCYVLEHDITLLEQLEDL